jgi:myo-inositol-1(or 4)-monophosphatase
MEPLLDLAVRAVDTAAETIRTSEPGTLTAKGDRDMASEVDFRVERETRALLAAATPDVGFLGEEDGQLGDPDRYWVLDPVDGTANFVGGIPLCAVSLALVEYGDSTVAAVRLPFLGQLYTAVRGRGAYEDERRLRVSGITDLHDAIVAIGDYAVGDQAAARNRVRLDLTRRLTEHAQRVRMLGTAAIDLAWVAAGRLDAMMTLSNHPWDMAAGRLLVEEAGGRVVDRDGSTHTPRSAVTIAAAGPLVGDLVALLAEAEALAPV